MKVSVIIPTYNEEESILDCLESLGKQSLADFEIIVVDDGSTDSTLSALQGLTLKVRVLKQEHKGAGAARNLGVKHAKGEILVFVDSDMIFDGNFLEELINPIVKKEAKGTLSKNEYVENWSNVWARCWNINEGWENKKRHPSANRNLFYKFYDYLGYSIPHLDLSLKNYLTYKSRIGKEVFRAILKSEFDRVGGYVPGGYNDDWSLRDRLGYNPEIVEGAKFFHKNPSSLDEIYKQAKWIGKRSYKLGLLGSLYALVRSSLPMSIIVGVWKSVINLEPRFLVFKVVYDLGVFLGILEYTLYKKAAK
ncbi:MAG: glycosyltransferase family 2 protein [Patescibacteria group bacterium]